MLNAIIVGAITVKNSLAVTNAPEQHSMLDQKRVNLFKLILQTTLVTSLLFGGANLLLFPANTHPLAVAYPLLIVSLIALILLKARRATFAIHFFLASTWLIFSYTSAVTFGGISSPSIYFLMLTIIVSGLLVGVKAGRIYSALVMLTISGIYLAGKAGLLPQANLLSTARLFQFAIINAVLTTLLVDIAVRNISGAFHEATQRAQELNETNHQLHLIQQDLENRIQDRTLEIESQKQYYEALFRNSPVSIMVLNMEMEVVSANPAFERLFGYSMEEVYGKDIDNIIAPSQYSVQANQYTQRVLRGEKIDCRVVRKRKDGSLIDLELFGVPVIVDEQQIGVLAIYNDISERKRDEERLQYLASHDSLTGLPNRSLFQERLQNALENAEQNHKSVGILFMDLDGFKQVNDAYGHEIGDMVLQIVSERLAGLLRHSDTVARLGGDEFAFILVHPLERMDASKIAERIMEVLKEPIRVKDHTVSVFASVGISLYPQDGTNPDDLMRNADHAMYAAKTQHSQLLKYDETVYQQ
jgi:diguanylate cyclase (GGDEF)-like protein/PAS domain S-box-containing protein